LTLAGVYAAFQVPISVFPETSFPRVVIGVDNGVMPVEQMQVTITKRIEDAVNSVPGLVTVRSTTSRGSAEISLFFDWNVDMFHTLQLTDAALSKVAQSLPATARITTNRLTFATFPILGYALTADDRGKDTVSQTRLWEIATYDLEAAAEPGRRGQHGDHAGRPGSRVPHCAQSLPAAGRRRNPARTGQCGAGIEHHRLARPL
jgi:Cu/Ag efflux pump CusA